MALLLLLLLLAVWNVGRSRRLSLLVRCLLASLIAHCVLMVLLNFWQVTTTLADALRRRGGIQVALVSPARGNDITAQILGELTDVDAPAPQDLAPAPPSAVPRLERIEFSASLSVDPRLRQTNDGPAIKPELSDAPEPGFQPPALEASLARLERSPPLELGLPAETSRIDAQEERPVHPPADHPPDAVARPPVDVLDPTPQRAAQVVLPPDESAGSAEQALEQRLVETTTIRGAAVAPPPRFAAAAPAIDRSTPPAISVALPTEQQPVKEEERLPIVADVTDRTPRAAPAFSRAASTNEMTTIRIDPGVSEFDPGPRMAPASWPDQIADARTADLPGGRPRVAAGQETVLPDSPALSLRLPTETQPPPERYAQRSPVARRRMVAQMGGSEKTEQAVARALNWLARHQSPDGRWDADRFDDGCGACDGQSEYEVDIALTGLSLLCFLGADHTQVRDGEYRDHVRRGLDWLVGRQRADGDLRGEDTMYSHGIASIALSEAYGMTGDAALADPVRRAVAFISRARNRRVGGWRYDPGQVGDTSVLGWQVMALTSARLAGIDVPAEDFEDARRWLDRVSKPSAPGLYAYQPQRTVSPAMTAEGMFTQQLLGLGSSEQLMQASAAFLLQHLPDWESQVNTYLWYYATLALFQHQGAGWYRWNEALTEQLLKNQETRRGADGSWPVVGRWASTGGRVYQTALCTLMLEVYYRYLPLFAQDRPSASVGAISGLVTDASTGRPLAGATVRLDLPRTLPLTAGTGDDGHYRLPVPRLPDFVALSASADGYVPAAANVAAAAPRENELVQDFQLRRQEEHVIVLEAVPEVHHLGNDRFEGAINSQFQKLSEGSSFSAAFDIREGLLSAADEAVVHMLTKGVQCPHEIRVNGRLLERRLSGSPPDGSFGDFAAAFPASLLEEGTNTIQIRAVACRGDLDDFAFVNLQVRLSP